MRRRTRLRDRVLPDYTRGEEITNTVTHIVGGAFGIVVLVLCVVFAALRKDPYRIIGASIYGASLVFLYTMSSVYHGLRTGTGKKVLQVLDHCTIYFLIGGTYTPVLFGPIHDSRPALSWIIFGIVWGVSCLAVVFTAIDHNKYAALSMICYLCIGWVIVFFSSETIESVGLSGFLWLLAGGIAYSIGALFYMLGGKMHMRYMHSVFHCFVLLGSILQFVAVFVYCILH